MSLNVLRPRISLYCKMPVVLRDKDSQQDQSKAQECSKTVEYHSGFDVYALGS